MTGMTDIQNSPRETIAAAVLSVLIHLLIIVGIALTMLLPAWEFEPPAPPPAEEPPLELTIVANEAPAAPAYVRTTPQNVPEAPKNAPFESDNNTVAASTAAPSGSAPMPSLEGRDAPALDLENRNYSAGPQAQAAQPPSEPSPEVAETPEPPAKTDPAPPTQLALREAPRPDPSEAQKPRPKKPEAPAVPPKPPSAAGFQPETRVTRIRGNISNRGRASLDAAATPLGRYKKMVSDAIGSRWYYYVNNQIGLLNIGTVDIRFQVGPDGKVRGARVLTNTSNESFASVSLTSILEAEIPPIPEEVAKLLDNGRLEIDYSFTILSN